MPYMGPHISIPDKRLIQRVLGMGLDEFEGWPEAVQDLALELAAELFLIRYNPFIDPQIVWNSVRRTFEQENKGLSNEYAHTLSSALHGFWGDFEADQRFRAEMIRRLGEFMPASGIDTKPNSRVECSTDATDLRMQLPLMVLHPESTEQIRDIVRLAGEMGFAIVPRGGGSGLTGGAIPSGRRCVVLSLSRLKAILDINQDDMLLSAQAGVITLTAIQAADEQGLLFTVDPASKSASSLGGNISENSGGPFAFEYGTTIDNIASYTMVTPAGEIIEVRRRNHPRHKVMPDETAIYDIHAEDGSLRETIELTGLEIRSTGLGKDVTNKYLGGLPGVQKEGVDGIITEAVFTLHPKPALSRTLCLEFYGRSMRNAMLVIKDVVALRDAMREQGDLVKISALEEFGPKYVQAIDYKKKSERYEGDPISVLLLQVDADDQGVLDRAAGRILDICGPYDNVDVFAAHDDRQAEIFWEDRHKLSAISKRTSGFKINEDIVIPMDVIPEFSDFLEQLNLYYLSKAYRTALQDVGRLPGFAVEDRFINMEFNFTSRVLMGDIPHTELSDQELEVQIFYFFRDLKSRYPHLTKDLEAVYQRMQATRIVVANHMHAGDGNCHVNIPVNSGDAQMLAEAEDAVHKVVDKVATLGGVVSGEHGIGITKIAFLPEARIKALAEYKAKVDPDNILNPGKLVSRELAVEPYTFSFNKLISDIKRSGIADKHRLISMLTQIQTCTRCGKCKQVCPMYDPEHNLMHHPRNRNISLGALVEAVYYTQAATGEPDKALMKRLRDLVDHCTACGKCMAACPVKIHSGDVSLYMRTFLEDKQAGHPVKTRILHMLASDPSRRLPVTAKALSLGQAATNKVVGLIPQPWRERLESPLFQGPGPDMSFKNLTESLHLERGSLFAPVGRESGDTVLYFPGCGAGLFSRSIGAAALYLLLDSGASVIMPPEHLCCGYPLLASGCEEAFEANRERGRAALVELMARADGLGLRPTRLLTSCGTCRDGLSRYGLERTGQGLEHADVTQYLMQRLPKIMEDTMGAVPAAGPELVYHAACHAEWTGVSPKDSGRAYAEALAGLTGRPVRISPGCCGESGLGAMTSPDIFNRIRKRKQEQLSRDLAAYPADSPVTVGCPSCKMGIRRSLLALGLTNPVLHSLEVLAEQRGGPHWRRRLFAAVRASGKREAVRRVTLEREHII